MLTAPLVRSGGDGETRTLTACAIRPSNVRVYQFHHIPENENSPPYFFAGEAAGAAAGFATGLALAVGLITTDGATLGATAGTDAAGDGEGDGVVVVPESLTTERGPLTPGNEKSSARNMKVNAATIVAFSSGFCAPRGPNAVWLPAPPKADATSPPFPDCSSTTRIRKTQARM